MPILLHVDDLKPGLCLSQAVYYRDRRLISGGQHLEQWHIDALRRRFPKLFVRVVDPVLDRLLEFEDDSQNAEVASAVTARMGRLMSSVQGKVGNRTALDGADLTGVQVAIREVMQYLEAHPVTAAVLLHSEGRGSYLQEHAANVMYLSLLVGNAIRDYIYTERVRTTHARTLGVRYSLNLTPLALGCLFHDLGMLELEELLYQTEPLTPEQQDRLRRHPLAGADMLPEEADAVVKMVVRTHHENVNGTGYPLGIPVSKLHVFSRIVRIADAFDAATSERVYRRAKPACRALWEMTLGPNHGCYDPVIAHVLSGLVQPFPIGAKIRLNCGRWGVVVRHNRRYPFRPRIIVAFDENGQRLPEKQLEPPMDLAGKDSVQLVEFAGQDLSFLDHGHAAATPAPPDETLRQWAEESCAGGCESRDLFSFVYP